MWSLDFKFSGKPLQGFKQRLLYLIRKITLTPMWKTDCRMAKVNIRSIGRLFMHPRKRR